MATMSELTRQYQSALEYYRTALDVGDLDGEEDAWAALADARAALEVGWRTWAADRLAGRGGRR